MVSIALPYFVDRSCQHFYHAPFEHTSDVGFDWNCPNIFARFYRWILCRPAAANQQTHIVCIARRFSRDARHFSSRVLIRTEGPSPKTSSRISDSSWNSCTFVFLTNHFELPAATIAALYAKRWQIELFFRWIKQNLRIKTFYGTSDNAVKTQIWIAICVYVLVAIVKKELQLPQSLYEILQILSVTPFEQVPLPELLAKAYDPTENSYDRNQLLLWQLR